MTELQDRPLMACLRRFAASRGLPPIWTPGPPGALDPDAYTAALASWRADPPGPPR